MRFCLGLFESSPWAVTNEALRLELERRATEARQALDGAAAQYEEVRGDAQALVAGEPFVYDLWKTFADPPALNAEAIAVQTNALTSLSPYQPAREDEAEVLALTQQFRLLFPQWAEEQQSQQEQAQQQQEKAKQEDLQALLQKADDRNREHEREKQRLRRVATPPSARDW